MPFVVILKVRRKDATMETRSVMIGKNNVLQYKALYKTLYYLRRNRKDWISYMKLNGTHKFKVSSSQVYNAILNPEILKSCIPGCESVEFVDANHIQANITTPLPGLRGPYGVTINIVRAEAPNHLEIQVQRSGRGGSVNALSQINITDEADGALLSYDANADLEGPVAVADNPVGKGITNNSLATFFKNLDKAIA